MPSRDLTARRHIRLQGWDYRSPGPYAMTIVTQRREWFFGDVVEGQVVLNDAGMMVDSAWREIVSVMPRVSLDSYVLMPNHLHAIVTMSHKGPAGNPTLGDVVHRFKAVTTGRYSTGVYERDWHPFDHRLWQLRFYDHIIHDVADLDRCRRYIAANPANWENDQDRDPDPPSRLIAGSPPGSSGRS